ncbi:hypothetical protein D3C81_1179020 [compost metagenome]
MLDDVPAVRGKDCVLAVRPLRSAPPTTFTFILVFADPLTAVISAVPDFAALKLWPVQTKLPVLDFQLA